MVKTTGLELSKFYTDEAYWGNGTWHEEEIITIDGAEIEEGEIDLGTEVLPASLVTLEGGIVWSEASKDMGSFESYFKKWKKAQTTVTVMVTVDKTKLDDLKAVIKTVGGKITV